MVTPVDVLLDESDIVRLILEYLSSRGLLVSMLTLERETGIVNGKFSDEGHFIRQLILDGQWNDVLSFIQPLGSIPSFDMKPLLYLVHKHRYLEMLNAKSELHPDNHEALVDEMVRCAASLEKLCPSKSDYDNLCVLLTLSNLADHVDYKNWNRLSARLECFEKIYSVISEFLPFETSSVSAISEVSSRRLIHLLVKGLLYESCSEFCLSNASTTNEAEDFSISSLIRNLSLSDSDLCLMSWLTILPPEVFAYSFERRALKLHVKPLGQIRKQLQIDFLQNTVSSKLSATSSLSSTNVRPFTLCLDNKNNHENNYEKPATSGRMASRSMHAISQLFEGCKGLEKKQSSKLPMSSCVPRLKAGDGLHKTFTKPVRFENEKDMVAGQSFLPASFEQFIDSVHENANRKGSTDDQLSDNYSTEACSEESKECLDVKPSKSYTLVSDVQMNRKFTDKYCVPKFLELIRLEDPQVIRTAAFHPNGRLFAAGSNSKVLHVCSYPSPEEIKKLIKSSGQPQPAKVLYTSPKNHRGSIYCISWNQNGSLIATGSNDKTIHLAKFCSDSSQIVGKDSEILCHDGTVRDLIFVDNTRLISGGAGDCRICMTDCETKKTIQALSSHKGHIYSLCGWGMHTIVSGSQDGTAIIWDLRRSSPISIISNPNKGSAFAAVAVDGSGHVLASGHEDSTCMLWDLRKSRLLRYFLPHADEVRSVRFSSDGHLLLTGSYDQTVKITDLIGIETELSPVLVARHRDKVIQCRWHPTDLSFITTSVDRTVGCWISGHQVMVDETHK